MKLLRCSSAAASAGVGCAKASVFLRLRSFADVGIGEVLADLWAEAELLRKREFEREKLQERRRRAA